MNVTNYSCGIIVNAKEVNGFKALRTESDIIDALILSLSKFRH